MKLLLNKKNLLIFILVLSFLTSSEAQIFKKLGKKMEQAAEKTLEKKVEQKTERETSKAFDSTFNNSSKQKKTNNNPVSFSDKGEDPAATYTFTHKYVMEINDGKRTTTLNYYMTPSGKYFANEIPDQKNGKTLTVMDMDKKTMYILMDNKGDKTLMSMGLNFEKATNHAIDETNATITATGKTKTILGYTCHEFKVKSEDVEGSVWVTQDAGISLAKPFYKSVNNQTQDANWKKIATGLTLEMDMVDTSKRKPKPIKMTCTSLDKINLTIVTKDYKKLM